eukprot:10282467-Alexandrium_andersonii.AAC.1
MKVSTGWEPSRMFRAKAGNCVADCGHVLMKSPGSLIARVKCCTKPSWGQKARTCVRSVGT